MIARTVFFIALFILVLGVNGFTQETPFQHEVETKQKPWTDKDFYNDPLNFQFALVTDNTGGSRPGVFESAMGKLNLLMPEFVLSVGDIIEGGTTDLDQVDKEWKEMNGYIQELEVPFFYLPGNHDISNEVMARDWERRFGKRYYDFTYKGVLFIIMDSNDDDNFNISMEQTNYVKDVIRRHPDPRHTFLLMHHPIWNQDTDGRFESIEEELDGDAYTVFAGHKHHYFHDERRGRNYYVLGTTGGGSRLRGPRFGEFDHITWVTMMDDGPRMANIRLDGILEHDIANAQTMVMAKAILDNVNAEKRMVCNKGDKFKKGTLSLDFKNPTKYKLQIDLDFSHHHEVNIVMPESPLVINPGGSISIEVPFESRNKADFDKLGLLKYYWEYSFLEDEYKDFKLSGEEALEIKGDD